MKRYRAIKKRVWEVVEVAKADDWLSKAFDIFIILLIVSNVTAVILETVPPLYSKRPGFFRSFEVVSVLIFTAEYLMRLWSCGVDERFSGIRGRIRFIFTPLAMVDLLAILPFYLPMVFKCDLRMLRMLRLVRFFRILKLSRYTDAMETFVAVLTEKKEELILALSFVVLLLLISSSLVYFFENEVQPDKFSSIPASMWWGICTITTVGYGDIYPVTTMGKILGSVISILGIAVFALPTGILASGFSARLFKKQKEVITCPYCGKQFEKEN